MNETVRKSLHRGDSASHLRGQAALPFLASLPVLILLSLLGSVAIGVVTAKATLHADRFYTARAHLYGNSIEECALANFWPKTIIKEFSVSCIGAHYNQAMIYFGEILGRQISIQSEIFTSDSAHELRPAEVEP